MNDQRTTNRFLQQVKLRNFLSFGPEPTALQCHALNVFIGPNASGKSNFLEALGMLARCPSDIQDTIRTGGGVQEWLWKGSATPPLASVEVEVESRRADMPLFYRLEFTQVGQRMEITDEVLENAKSFPGKDMPYFFYRFQRGHPVLNVHESTKKEGFQSEGHLRKLQAEDIDLKQSILSQRKDPQAYPEITHLGRDFARIRLYREWNFGRNTTPRLPQPADLPEDFLLEDASNLGLVLNDLQHQASSKNAILGYLKKFYEQVESYSVKVYGGTVQVYVHEKGTGSPIIPATRLSDGTLRYLCLLAVLCHPTPPPVVCIEEPEIGLHPDMIATVAELLRGASRRTQLFITTHSDALVDALTDSPDAVIVCERGDNGTQLKRLEPDKLKDWLKRYSLGELWMKGEIGGARW
jgi:predicted ATPase